MNSRAPSPPSSIFSHRRRRARALHCRSPDAPTLLRRPDAPTRARKAARRCRARGPPSSAAPRHRTARHHHVLAPAAPRTHRPSSSIRALQLRRPRPGGLQSRPAGSHASAGRARRRPCLLDSIPGRPRRRPGSSPTRACAAVPSPARAHRPFPCSCRAARSPAAAAPPVPVPAAGVVVPAVLFVVVRLDRWYCVRSRAKNPNAMHICFCLR
jgi:hypothetical protein